MKTLLFLFSLTFSFSLLADVTKEEQALCGDAPTDQSEEKEKREKATELSRMLPPVMSQNPASWCYAFASAPLLEHHRLMDIMKKEGVDKQPSDEQILFASKFYSDLANRISPFEVIYSNNYQVSIPHKDAKDYRPNDPGVLSLDQGGDPTNIFWGVQERGYKLRSLKQVYFTSIDDKDPETKSMIEGLIERYKKEKLPVLLPPSNGYYLFMGCKIDSNLFESPGFTEYFNGFALINNKLEELAQVHSYKMTNKKIENYRELSDLLNKHEDPDIEIPPYTTSFLQTNDPLEILGQVKKNLDNKRPLVTGICSYDIEFNSRASTNRDPNDSCGDHAVSIVGAYYRNGRCMVNLRNSWGVDWPEKGAGGHKEVSVSDFLKLQESISSKRSSTAPKYSVQWIEPAFGVEAKVYTKFKNSTGSFEGEGSFKLVSPYSSKGEFKTGQFRSNSGEIHEYKDNVMIRFHRNGKWYKRNQEGKYFLE